MEQPFSVTFCDLKIFTYGQEDKHTARRTNKWTERHVKLKIIVCIFDNPALLNEIPTYNNFSLYLCRHATKTEVIQGGSFVVLNNAIRNFGSSTET